MKRKDFVNLECPKGPIDLVIDSDTYNEIDDQFAISYAIHAQEKIRVQAIYAAPFFNERSIGPADGMEKSFQEIRRLLTLSRKDYPVFRGSESYLPDEKHAAESDAARDLVNRARLYSPENPLYVVAIGAIINIASALLMDMHIADQLVIILLNNGRKLGCRVFSDTVYTVGTYRQGPLYEWFYLVPTVVDGRITEVVAVDREGIPDSNCQKEWEAYADIIIALLPDSRKKKLEMLMK